MRFVVPTRCGRDAEHLSLVRFDLLRASSAGPPSRFIATTSDVRSEGSF